MTQVLSLKNVSKTFNNGKSMVLDNVSLTINKGDFLSLVGASGSGKSTLLTILGGIDKPTSGKVLLFDKDITDLKERELAVLRRTKIGFVFQFFNLVPNLTAYENIALPIVLSGKKTKDLKQNIYELTSYLGIKEQVDKLPSKLSGGEQQRVAIARAMVYKPQIMLLDEPTGNLDSTNTFDIMRLLKDINTQFATTIVMVTHSEACAQYGDKIISIRDGKII